MLDKYIKSIFTTPKEISEAAKNHDLKILRNIGVNFKFNKDLINNMDEGKLKCWLEFSEYIKSLHRIQDLFCLSKKNVIN